MGNWLNKDWSQQIDSTSGDDTTSINENCNDQETVSKAKLFKRRLSNLVSNSTGENNIEYTRVSSLLENNNSTPTPSNAKSKVMAADFDPRSPSSDIVRTPIFYMSQNSADSKSSSVNTNSKFPINDPRSPTTEYNRTPIHISSQKPNCQSIESNPANSDNLNESSSSLDSSCYSSDSSILLQHVPENVLNQNGSDSPTQHNGLKVASSNMPRHILQRKQVEKLNKKKLIDFQDKEN